MVRVPESERVGVAASSVTAPEASPPMTAASLMPVMTTLTWWDVPSAARTVKVSVLVSPALRYWTLVLGTE